jgi:hypothetical protein
VAIDEGGARPSRKPIPHRILNIRQLSPTLHQIERPTTVVMLSRLA